MATLVAVWENTELAIAEIESLDYLREGIQDILDQILGTPYEEIIEDMRIEIIPH